MRARVVVRKGIFQIFPQNTFQLKSLCVCMRSTFSSPSFSLHSTFLKTAKITTEKEKIDTKEGKKLQKSLMEGRQSFFHTIKCYEKDIKIKFSVWKNEKFPSPRLNWKNHKIIHNYVHMFVKKELESEKFSSLNSYPLVNQLSWMKKIAKEGIS